MMFNKNLFLPKWVALVLPFILSVLLGSCQQQDQPQMSDVEIEEEPDINAAIAVLHPTEGHQVTGVVKFTQRGDGIQVVADVSGLEPGSHGFHIHQYGDCSASDGTSAGGHFAPDGNPHGAPTDAERHVGDMGNIVADENGNAHLDWVDSDIAFDGTHSVIGRAVIVHAGEDDFTSQPTGNAGPRVACGVIGIAE